MMDECGHAERWDEIAGNDEVKDYFDTMIRAVRQDGKRTGFNMLLTGPSRTGKTSVIAFGIKCLGCLNLDFETLNPCGRCSNCTMNHHLYGNDGWERYVDVGDGEEVKTDVRYHYQPIDCTRITDPELDYILGRLRVNGEIIRVVYLDEVHRLVRRNMDEKLLKPMEDYAGIWIASSAYVRRADGEGELLDKMFQNRFTYRIITQKPTPFEMVIWLGRRCRDWQINVEQPVETLTRLAERSDRVVGLAVQVLAKARNSRKKALTRDQVEKHTFDLDA